MRGGPTAPHAQSQSRSILTKDYFMQKFLILTITALTLSTPMAHASSMLTATHAATWLDRNVNALVDARNQQHRLNLAAHKICADELLDAASRNDIIAVRKLVDAGVDVNKHDVLYDAAHHANLAMFKLLINAGAQVKANHLSALAYSLGENYTYHQGHSILKPDTNIEQYAQDIAKIMRMIINENVNINAVNEYSKRSALHNAARYGNSYVVEALMTHGADITLKDFEGKTALDLAMQSYHSGGWCNTEAALACVQMLVAKNAPCSTYTKLLMAWYL